ncbi:MAG: peptide ABC transporter substrate-binding protein [Chloroflexota bacterium]
MNNYSYYRLFIASTALALCTLVFLVGCAVASTPEATSTPDLPTPTPLPRGGTLTVGLSNDVTDLRPWQPRSRSEEHSISLLYNGLMYLDPQLRPQPDLAEDWFASADGRLITFTLRSNVVWHDGAPFSADDVAYTLNALRELSPTTALLADFQRIQEVSVPASNTVVLSLTERYAPIFSSLTVPILPRHILEDMDISEVDFWEIPVGTGPFQFAERREEESTEFTANPAFFRGQPLLDRVALVVAPDPEVMSEALIDEQLLLAEPTWDDSRSVLQDAVGLRTESYLENGYYFMAFNVRSGRPFADREVRQALGQAVDWPQLIDEVTDGQGRPIANSAVPESWADFIQPVTETVDLERATDLLDEAGWIEPSEGEIREREGELLEGFLFVRGDDQRRVEAAEMIADAAATIGMSITVQPADFDTVIESKYLPPYDFDLLLGSWSNGAGDQDFADFRFYDPDDFALFHSSQINQGIEDTRPVLNIGGFEDTSYDNQAAAAYQLYDLEQRGQAIRLAQERIAEELPYIFLWTDRIPVVLNETVTTLDGPINISTPLYFHNIERWYIQDSTAN